MTAESPKAESPTAQSPTAEPLVSIIIPAYQAESYLGAAISSALTQTYPNIEVVVTDDGATDRTAAIAAAYGDLVRVVTQPNRGLPAARNAGIAAATGDYILTLDADDLALPPMVADAMAVLAADGSGRRFVTSDGYLMTSAGITPGRTVLPSGYPADDQQRAQILEFNFVAVFSLFPKAMWVELGGYDESMRVCEDYDFWARAIYSGWRVSFQKKPHALYRRTSGSLSTQHERMYSGEQLVLQHVLDGFGDTLSADERSYLQLRLASGSTQQALNAGDAALRAGDASAAAEHFALAARLNPSNRRIALKAKALRFQPAARLYASRLQRADHEMGRTNV